MLKKVFSLTMVAFGLCLVTSVFCAGQMDQQMVNLETNISQITTGTHTLTELRHSGKG